MREGIQAQVWPGEGGGGLPREAAKGKRGCKGGEIEGAKGNGWQGMQWQMAG